MGVWEVSLVGQLHMAHEEGREQTGGYGKCGRQGWRSHRRVCVQVQGVAGAW